MFLWSTKVDFKLSPSKQRWYIIYPQYNRKVSINFLQNGPSIRHIKLINDNILYFNFRALEQYKRQLRKKLATC